MSNMLVDSPIPGAANYAELLLNVANGVSSALVETKLLGALVEIV